ncbi:MAG TPA: HesA/MoeB/ThiF family protein [Sphingobacteriaceae bacterium]
MERYQRQVILKDFGDTGQHRLLTAKVLVIGAGGLGCPVLQYLTGAGVGTIGIMDHDVVSLSNLHRQVLYDMADIGLPKAGRAAAKLQQMNSDIRVIPYVERLVTQNALEILGEYDVIVDATDNFPTRYLINDACVLLCKPLVYGAVSRYEGQVAVFNFTDSSGERTVNYRDLFPVLPPDGEVENCAEAGVLGILPGIIGSLQAGEVIKLLAGVGTPLVNRLQTFNLLTNEWLAWEIPPSPGSQAQIPGSRADFINMEYEHTCQTTGFSEIDVGEFDAMLSEKDLTVIDVREMGELPEINEFNHLQLPLSQLQTDRLSASISNNIIIAFCQSGKRSQVAARLFADTFTDKRIFSLRGGIIAWKQHIKYKHD